MNKLNERKECIDQIVELAQECDSVGALVVYGDNATESGDVRIDAVPAEDTGVMIAYTRFSYLLASEFDGADGQLIERDSDRRVKKFSLDNGVALTVGVCSEDRLKTDGWYRIVFDEMGLASKLTDSVPEDILCDVEAPAEPEPAPEPEKADDFDDDFDNDIDVVAAPVVIEEKPEPEPAAEEDDGDVDKYVEYVSRNLKNAQRAIASGQMIRAGEIVAVLRKMAIELICVRNGITENFEQSIDFIDCEEKRMIMKAYPHTMDQKNLVSCLSTLSELFDRLI